MHKADPTHPRTVYILFLLIFSIPLLSLYIGYYIGTVYQSQNRKLPQDLVVVKHKLLNATLKNTHCLAVDISGSLADIMFQYASLYGISKANQMIPVMDARERLRSIFPGLAVRALQGETDPSRLWSRFVEQSGIYDTRVASLNFGKNILLKGRFQSWRYFNNSQKDLRKQFRFASTTENDADQFLAHAFLLYQERFPKVRADQVRYVGVHVKRGDKLADADLLDYIKRAMHYFGAEFKHIIFAVVSKEKHWTRGHVKSEEHLVVHSPHTSSSLDLCILSRCNHTVMTTGAFGWWAAFLANGETTYLRNIPLQKAPQAAQQFVQRDFYYPHWIGL